MTNEKRPQNQKNNDRDASKCDGASQLCFEKAFLWFVVPSLDSVAKHAYQRSRVSKIITVADSNISL